MNLNEKISFKLTDISYTFEDESEEDDDKELIEESKTGDSKQTLGVKTRRKDKKEKEVEHEKKRQPKQIKLRKQKIEEIKNRYSKGELVLVKKSEVIDLTTLCCYKNEDEMERDLKRKVYLDE